MDHCATRNGTAVPSGGGHSARSSLAEACRGIGQPWADGPRFAIVMGVSGARKTTVGRQLAKQLCWNFVDGDAVHPPQNVAKMKSGRPLTDVDRTPWLAALG